MDPNTDLVGRMVRAAGLTPRGAQIVGLGGSGNVVARLQGGLYAKIACADQPDRVEDLARETHALACLAGKVPVPKIVWAGEADGRLALITTALTGAPVSQVEGADVPRALAATIETLAVLHALPLATCPFEADVATKLAHAEARLARGLIDEDDFDDERQGWSVAQVLAEVRRTAPTDEQLVPTHGDACLPNIIWSSAHGVGLIDLGRFGLADPYQDLALVLRSAARNHPGVATSDLMRAHYPLARIDSPRCDFYRLLDELF